MVPKDRIFLHGKAGVIEAADGSKTCFLGSINETKCAFADNYEILWEDTSPEGVAWVEEEFAALWDQAYPLPEAIVDWLNTYRQHPDGKLHIRDRRLILPGDLPMGTRRG